MDCDRSLASPVKRHGEEPSSPTPSKRLHLRTSGKRACIIFDHRDIDERMKDKVKVEYSICIVDLDSDCSADAFIPITPTLQYESEFEIEKGRFSSDAFCVLGETLYIFEGTRQIGDSCKKSVFTFDLSSLRLDSTTLKLDKTNLVKIGEMGSPKTVPVVIPTPDNQKIVVLPSNNFPFRRCDTIELYDSVSRTWEELPPLEVKGWMLSRLSYGFINECTLLIEINRVGMYVLDLAASNMQWVHVDRICCDARRIPSYHGASNFVLIEDRFCFSDTAAFDLQAFSDLCYDELSCAGGFSWPFVALPTGFGLHPYHSAKGVVVVDGMIAFLSYNQQLGEVDYCQLRVERLRLPHCGNRFIIDVCRSDLNAYIDDYKEEKSLSGHFSYITGNLMKTAIVKSYKFSLTLGQQKRQLWPPRSFFCF